MNSVTHYLAWFALKGPVLVLEVKLCLLRFIAGWVNIYAAPLGKSGGRSGQCTYHVHDD